MWLNFSVYFLEEKKKAFHTPCPFHQKGDSFFKLRLYI